MSDTDLSITAIIQSLMTLSRDLDAAQRMLAEADLEATHAKHDYETAFARAAMVAEGGNAEVRKASATLATEALSLNAEVKAAVVRSLRSRMDVLKVRVEVGRSLSSALKSEGRISA